MAPWLKENICSDVVLRDPILAACFMRKSLPAYRQRPEILRMAINSWRRAFTPPHPLESMAMFNCAAMLLGFSLRTHLYSQPTSTALYLGMLPPEASTME